MASDQALSQDLIKEFVTASHFDLAKVKAMLAERPSLLNVEYEWSPGDWESGILAAGHMGNRAIAEFFLEQGAPLSICVAAMLGRYDDVKAFLEQDASLANARGAHNITVMFHTAMSGNADIAELLKAHGCNEGYSYALHGAINYQRTGMARWLLNNGATQLDAKDFQGKTLLQRATETDLTAVADLLRARGVTE